jgi:hypothetical protein
MGLMTTSKLLQRLYTFDLALTDGNVGYKMDDCKITSLSLTGAAGGIVAVSLSVVAPTAEVLDALVTNDFIRDDTLVGYWWSGAKSPLKAKSWTFSMSQEVTPFYGNKDEVTPLYMRVGLVEYTLEVESYTELAGDSDTIYIETKMFTLVGTSNEKGFQYNGVTELGTYRYNFGTGAPSASDDTVIS